MKIARAVLDKLVEKGLLCREDVQARKSKYRNEPTTRMWKGKEVRFASHREARRFDYLVWAWGQGRIWKLRLQVPYELVVDGQLITTYVADFVYHDGFGEVVEDAKGCRTRLYKIKKRLMRALYGITILEV